METTALELAKESPNYVITVLFVMLLWASHTWKDNQMKLMREDMKAKEKENKELRQIIDGELKDLNDSISRLEQRMDQYYLFHRRRSREDDTT